jgi:hypothetical protein
MEDMTDLTVHLATDSGLLALCVPAGLTHHAGDYSWWFDEDVLLGEANAGRIVPIETGESGGYAVRVTFEPLQDRERRVAAQSGVFWLRVGDDAEVAVVAGEELSFPDTPGAATFWTAPGSYRVTVTRLRWSQEDDGEEDALPDYIVRLRPFRSDEAPPSLSYLPDLSATSET